MAVAAQPLHAQFSDSSSFLDAVKKRDGGKATQYLNGPGNVIVNTRQGGSPGDGAIHIVTRGRDLTWLSFLIGKGARPDLQNADGNSALAVAAQIGWVEGAQLLIGQGATVDLPNRRGETPLILAAQNRDLAMTRLLLASGADPKRTDDIAGLSARDYAHRDPRAAAVAKVLDAQQAPAKHKFGPNF